MFLKNALEEFLHSSVHSFFLLLTYPEHFDCSGLGVKLCNCITAFAVPSAYSFHLISLCPGLEGPCKVGAQEVLLGVLPLIINCKVFLLKRQYKITADVIKGHFHQM